MLARVMASSRRFGLVATRRDAEDGTIGRCTVGTILEVTKCQQLPDGRALIECCGCERFSIVDAELQDGYYVATVQKLEDREDAEASSHYAEIGLGGEDDAASNQSVTRRPAESVDAYTRRLLATIMDSDAPDGPASRLRAALRELGPPPPVEEGGSRLGMWLAEHLIHVASQRQALLEMSCPEERLIAISAYLQDGNLASEVPAGACTIC